MKPRFGAKVDAVQPAIVADLRDRGAKVLVLDVGEEGAPDLAVLYLGTVTFLELKTATGKLRPEQVWWHEEAAKRGIKVHTVKTPLEARQAVGMEGPRLRENLKAMAALAGQPVELTTEADIDCGAT